MTTRAQRTAVTEALIRAQKETADRHTQDALQRLAVDILERLHALPDEALRMCYGGPNRG